VEHETLNAEEVQKIIKGEPIRSITEFLEEDVANVESELP
jgi:ATP-dependent metalloprotease